MNVSQYFASSSVSFLVKSVNWSKEIYSKQKENNTKKSIKAQIVKRGIPRKRTRQAEGLEKKLERELKNVFGKRLVVVGNEEFYSQKQVQKIVKNQMHEKGFLITPKTRILGAGNYRGSCAHSYPSIFANTHRIGMRQTKHTLQFKSKKTRR